MKKLLGYLIAFCLPVLAGAQNNPRNTDSLSGTYTRKADMPTKRYGISATGYEGKMYVLGGSDLTNILTVVEVYDPATDTWSNTAPLPTATTEAYICTVGNKIYVVGGWTAGGATNAVQEYDPATDKWAVKSPMPTSRAIISGGVVNGKIHITGGWNQAYTQLEIYDPATDKWTTGKSCPTGFLQNNGGLGFNGYFYTIGGRNYSGSMFYNHNLRYNPATDAWQSMAPLPASLYSGVALEYNGRIHYIGGSYGGSNKPPYWNMGIYLPNAITHYAYTDSTDSWQATSPLPEPRSGPVAVSLNGKIYIAGGMDSAGNVTNTLWEYSEILTPASGNTHIPTYNTIPLLTAGPNPAANTLTIHTSSAGGTVHLTDLTGRVLQSHTLATPDAQIDISTLRKGLYLLRYQTGTQQQTIKINKY